MAQTMRGVTLPPNRTIISPPHSIHQPMPSTVCHIPRRSRGLGDRFSFASGPAYQPENGEPGLHGVSGYPGGCHIGHGIPVDVRSRQAYPDWVQEVHDPTGQGIAGAHVLEKMDPAPIADDAPDLPQA